MENYSFDPITLLKNVYFMNFIKVMPANKSHTTVLELLQIDLPMSEGDIPEIIINRFDAVSAYMRKMDHYGLSDF